MQSIPHFPGGFASFSPALTPPQHGAFQSMPVHQAPTSLFQTPGPALSAVPAVSAGASRQSPPDRNRTSSSRKPPGSSGQPLTAEQAQQKRDEEEYKHLKSIQDSVARHHFVRNQAAEVPDSVDLLEKYVAAEKEDLVHQEDPTADKQLGLMGLDMFVDHYAQPPPDASEQTAFDGLTSISEAQVVLKQLEVFNKELLGGRWPERQIKQEASKWKPVATATLFAAQSIVRSQSRGKTRRPAAGAPKLSPPTLPQASPTDFAGGWVVRPSSRSPPTRPAASPPLRMHSPPLAPATSMSLSPPTPTDLGSLARSSLGTLPPAGVSPPLPPAPAPMGSMNQAMFQSIAAPGPLQPRAGGGQGVLLGQPPGALM